jgi:ABC-type cobalamin/Fe3+-siderophores transport system ATPase subunit
MAYDLLDANGNEVLDEQGQPIHQRYLLSLQDLDRSAWLQELIDAGVTTFKIEGRLKDADYVTNITAYYREKLDAFCHQHSVISRSFTPNPEKTFHRGATDYFLHGRTRPMANWNTPKSTGEYIGEVPAATASQQSLTDMMVGRAVSLNIDRPEAKEKRDRLLVEHLTVKDKEGVNKLDDVTFTAMAGEILGIAGIAGSGQRELLEAIAGLQHVNGKILYHNPKTGQVDDLRDKSPLEIRELGVRLSFVPEDRLGMGLVGNMDIVDNIMLRSYKKGKSVFLERKNPRSLAEKIIKDLEVATPSANTPVRRLSGGNVQKVLVGREIAASPTVLMAAYPVRGLDINASFTIYNLLNQQKENGVAVIFVGEDLDVLLALCDRIMVISSGSISGIVDARTATKEEVGLLMTKNSADAYAHTAAEGGDA